MWRGSVILFSIFVLLLTWTACSTPSDSSHIETQPTSLVVGTLYSPTSFFILRGDTLGYDYDRVKDFASHNGITLKFKVAHNVDELIEMLNTTQIDLIATEVPNIPEYRKKVLNCGAINETQLTLVQNTKNIQVTHVTELAGKTVCVEQGSHNENILNTINSEMGGTINILPFSRDSVSSEGLMEMVNNGKINYAVVNSDIALFNNKYFNNIDTQLRLGITMLSSWAVRANDSSLAMLIDKWNNSNDTRAYSKTALERYVMKSHITEDDHSQEIPHLGSASSHWGTPSRTHLPQSPSSYDDLFRKYGGGSGWNWHLLSAVARVESHFNPKAHSWAGARGLMQVMPGTARGYGIDPDMLFDPETNVRVAARCLRDLNRTFQNKVPNRDERLKFILAAYNAGAGHVIDAMALAQKHGKNPQVWYENVEVAMLWKSNPQYYNDPICRYGYCRGSETVEYVKAVLRGRR